MPAVFVPDLRRKFELLRAHPPGRTWKALGEAFDTPFKTLQTWQDGKDGREAGLMPASAVPILTRLIGDMLPEPRSAEGLGALVFGPAAELEDEMRSGPAGSLLALIAREGRRDTAALISRGASLELVEVVSAREPARFQVALGEKFRLTFRRRLPSGRLLALQHAQQAWAVLAAAPSPAEPALILVPDADEDGEPVFMAERRDLGRHLFVCFETAAPVPASLTGLAHDEVAADRRALGVLAEFYAGLPKAQRACHMLALDVVPAERS